MSQLQAPTFSQFRRALSRLGVHVPALLESFETERDQDTIADFMNKLPRDVSLQYDDKRDRLELGVGYKLLKTYPIGDNADAYVVKQGLLSLVPDEKQVLYVRWMIVVPTGGEPIYYSNAQYPDRPIYSGTRSNAHFWLSEEAARETLTRVHTAGHNPTARLRKVTTTLRRK